MGIAQIWYREGDASCRKPPKSHGFHPETSEKHQKKSGFQQVMAPVLIHQIFHMFHPAIRTLWDPPTGIAYEINAAGHGLGVEKKLRGLGMTK